MKRHKDIKVLGIAEVKINNKTVFKCVNRFTRYLMGSLAILLGAIKTAQTGGSFCGSLGHIIDARVGTDTTTPTEPTMSDLVSKIDIEPSSKVRRLIVNKAGGLFIAEHEFTWDAGILPNTTIGELGVYFYLGDDSWTSPALNLNTPGNVEDPWINSAKRLGARVSSASGDFEAFYHYGSIDPLIFKWRLQVVRA